MVSLSIRPEEVLEIDLVPDGLLVGLLADLLIDLLVNLLFNWEHIQPLPTLGLVAFVVPRRLTHLMEIHFR